MKLINVFEKLEKLKKNRVVKVLAIIIAVIVYFLTWRFRHHFIK